LLLNVSPAGHGKPLSVGMAEKLGWIMVGFNVKLSLFHGRHSWGPKASIDAALQWIAEQSAKGR
jgi:hypothetical protein